MHWGSLTHRFVSGMPPYGHDCLGGGGAFEYRGTTPQMEYPLGPGPAERTRYLVKRRSAAGQIEPNPSGEAIDVQSLTEDIRRDFLKFCERLGIPETLIPRLVHGFDVAAEMLRDCVRKSGELYLAHPVRATQEFLKAVVTKVNLNELSEANLTVIVDRAIAYLNHDSIEEYPEHHAESVEKFNGKFCQHPAIPRIVEGLTQQVRRDNPNGDLAIRWQDRIDFLEHIHAHSIAIPAVIEGKFFDLWDNAHDLKVFDDPLKVTALARRIHWFELVERELFNPETRRDGIEFQYVTGLMLEALREKIHYLILRYSERFEGEFTRELTAHRLMTAKLLSEN